MIWALYHRGISHKSAIRRGRSVARVRYLAWRTAIPRVAWTNGTISGHTRAKKVVFLHSVSTLRPSPGPCDAFEG